ncbi:MAG: hypothetical protein IH940_12915 [Acidobacteria bacterium]|nr:hypothetical protein [Acidobacteriota bacterium]
MAWCFQCARSYVDGETECVECAVGLVDREPMQIEVLGAGGVDLIAYELQEWNPDVRLRLEVTLSQIQIVHRWDGASLMIRDEHEGQVDEIIDEMERAYLPTLDPELDHVAFDFKGWSDSLRDQVSARLGLDSITHEFDTEGDLVVHAEDTDTVDDLIEEFRTELLAEQRVDGTDVLEGLEVADLLAEVFIGAQRLAKNPNDHSAVLTSVDAIKRLMNTRCPFGFAAVDWFAIRDDADAVTSILEADGDDDELADVAAALRDRLRPVV